jgi:cytochrome P450
VSHSNDGSGVVARPDPEAEKLYFQLMMSTGDDPFPDYARLRETAPALLTSDGSTLVLSRHEDCDAALRNRSFGKSDEWLRLHVNSVPEEQLRPVMERMQRSMILANPPDHTRLRKLVSFAFTARHVEALRPTITERTDQFLDELADTPDGNFMQILAMPLPVHVISDLLGVPVADRDAIAPHIHDMGLLIEPAAGPDDIVLGAKAENSLGDYFTELLADKRANPRDDMLTRMTQPANGDKLSEVETVATAILLFAGGNKPTANMLGNGLQALFDTPEQLELLRTDRSLIPSAVEEMLRYDAPAHVDVISVIEPCTYLDAELVKGQVVISLLGAANRDPERFSDPDTFDIARADNRHLSFGGGLHYCLGGPLARLEGEIFLNRLFDRFSGITPAGTPKRAPGLGHHGFEELPVNLVR